MLFDVGPALLTCTHSRCLGSPQHFSRKTSIRLGKATLRQPKYLEGDRGGVHLSPTDLLSTEPRLCHILPRWQWPVHDHQRWRRNHVVCFARAQCQPRYHWRERLVCRPLVNNVAVLIGNHQIVNLACWKRELNWD